MEKNVASQEATVLVFDSATGLPKTGLTDVTCYIRKDTGSFTIVTANSGVATECDATHAKGWYKIALSQSETNANELVVAAYSAGTSTYASAGARYTTTAPNFGVTSINSSGQLDIIKVNGTSQTAGDIVDYLVTTGVKIIAASRAGIRKNTALSNFEILMTDSTNHNPATGLTVTVTRSIDGGSFSAGTLGSVSAVSNGMYKFDFGAGDLNGDVITLRATATGADDTFVTIKTSP